MIINYLHLKKTIHTIVEKLNRSKQRKNHGINSKKKIIKRKKNHDFEVN
jgi:hypothetical protein